MKIVVINGIITTERIHFEGEKFKLLVRFVQFCNDNNDYIMAV